MENPVLVRVLQAIGDLNHDGELAFQVKRGFFEKKSLQAVTFEQVGHRIADVAFFADRVTGGDIGVSESCDGAPEPLLE